MYLRGGGIGYQQEKERRQLLGDGVLWTNLFASRVIAFQLLSKQRFFVVRWLAHWYKSMFLGLYTWHFRSKSSTYFAIYIVKSWLRFNWQGFFFHTRTTLYFGKTSRRRYTEIRLCVSLVRISGSTVAMTPELPVYLTKTTWFALPGILMSSKTCVKVVA